jgi:hypothetical protein
MRLPSSRTLSLIRSPGVPCFFNPFNLCPFFTVLNYLTFLTFFDFLSSRAALALPCPVLSCPVLSCPVLPCPSHEQAWPVKERAPAVPRLSRQQISLGHSRRTFTSSLLVAVQQHTLRQSEALLHLLHWHDQVPTRLRDRSSPTSGRWCFPRCYCPHTEAPFAKEFSPWNSVSGRGLRSNCTASRQVHVGRWRCDGWLWGLSCLLLPSGINNAWPERVS